VIIFGSVRFLSKKVTKQKNFKKKQNRTETGSNRPVSVRFGFFRTKTGSDRFDLVFSVWLDFGSAWLVFSGLARFWLGLARFWFGFFGFARFFISLARFFDGFFKFGFGSVCFFLF
jgi:hypothetical protein